MNTIFKAAKETWKLIVEVRKFEERTSNAAEVAASEPATVEADWPGRVSSVHGRMSERRRMSIKRFLRTSALSSPNPASSLRPVS